MNTCTELGCGALVQDGSGRCVEHRAQMWPLWSAHPLDEPCPPDCPTRLVEDADFFRSHGGGVS